MAAYVTSMQDIADAVGVTRAGLYHFVASKEALLSEIVDVGVERLDPQRRRGTA